MGRHAHQIPIRRRADELERLLGLGGDGVVGHELDGDPEGGIEFFGGSFVCDPFGVVLKEASRTDEEILIVECDRARIEEVRRNWPFLR
ncbi:MAG: nitrilase-related carbon-nitrogen hydrolase, partial [Polyangia bacterium]